MTKIKIDRFNLYVFASGVILVGLGNIYAKKYYPLADSTKYKNIIGAFLICGGFIQISILLTALAAKKWWQKKYPPKTNSTDSEVIDNNPPKDGNITE